MGEEFEMLLPALRATTGGKKGPPRFSTGRPIVLFDDRSFDFDDRFF